MGLKNVSRALSTLPLPDGVTPVVDGTDLSVYLRSQKTDRSDYRGLESIAMSDFTGKTALITGSTQGVGRDAAGTLAASGARVLITGRNVERGEKAVAEIRAVGGEADFLVADLHDAASAKALAAEAVALAGEIDILVNNAGVYILGPTASVTEADFDAIYDLNVKVPFSWSRSWLR